MFRTMYDRQNEMTMVSESGSRFHERFSSRYNSDGVIELIPDGQDDIYIQIQSHAPSCDINNIVKRYALGDVTALNRRSSVYMDITSLPTNFADLLNTIRAGEEMFESLSLDERTKYGNDFAQWLVAQGQSDAVAPSVPVVENVKEDKPDAES